MEEYDELELQKIANQFKDLTIQEQLKFSLQNLNILTFLLESLLNKNSLKQLYFEKLNQNLDSESFYEIMEATRNYMTMKYGLDYQTEELESLQVKSSQIIKEKGKQYQNFSLQELIAYIQLQPKHKEAWELLIESMDNIPLNQCTYLIISYANSNLNEERFFFKMESLLLQNFDKFSIGELTTIMYIFRSFTNKTQEFYTAYNKKLAIDFQEVPINEISHIIYSLALVKNIDQNLLLQIFQTIKDNFQNFNIGEKIQILATYADSQTFNQDITLFFYENKFDLKTLTDQQISFVVLSLQLIPKEYGISLIEIYLQDLKDLVKKQFNIQGQREMILSNLLVINEQYGKCIPEIYEEIIESLEAAVNLDYFVRLVAVCDKFWDNIPTDLLKKIKEKIPSQKEQGYPVALENYLVKFKQQLKLLQSILNEPGRKQKI